MLDSTISCWERMLEKQVLPVNSSHSILLPLRGSPPAASHSRILVDYLARAQKQKGDNGQWRNTKGQTQSVSALDGDEWGVIRRLPSRPPSLRR